MVLQQPGRLPRLCGGSNWCHGLAPWKPRSRLQRKSHNSFRCHGASPWHQFEFSHSLYRSSVR